MQKRTIFILGLMPVLAIMWVGASNVFAQAQIAHAYPESPPEPEYCVTCHDEVGEKKHQSIYDHYADASSLELTIDSVTSDPNGTGGFDATMRFTILKNGFPYLDVDGLPSLEQKRFVAVTYDSATRMFDNAVEFSNPVALGNGQYSVTATGITYDPNNSNGQAYGYIADGLLDTESGGHVHMYDDVANAGLAFGDVSSYESAANVSGCEKCHGKPYMKHGYRAPEVEGLSDFSSCKSCHYDTRDGGHEDWQILVDNPARYAELYYNDEDLTAEEEAKYAYKAKLRNDVHMSHAMEFPFPQSMSNCATCHEGKLDIVLSNTNFKAEVCKSCHPVTGPEEGTDPHRAPALKTIMPQDIHGAMMENLDTVDCTLCHRSGGVAEEFSELMTGYDQEIYADTSGTKWSEIFTASVDDASLNDNILTIKFSAVETNNTTELHAEDIVPTVLIGLYGYDTKHFIVNPHNRDEDENRLLEYDVDGETVNPRFTTVSAEGGSWEVTADLSMWADKIADGIIKRVEIGILPELVLAVEHEHEHEDEDEELVVALNAPSRTFDLTTNTFDDDYFGDVVDVAGCNKCHDALATTFHTAKRGGNIKVCKMCHAPTNDGSHIELASRSIDSYVHAIHSFQAFDIGDVNFLDPVEAVHYDLHIEHVFPNFTIKNCEACHNEGTFNVPDQSKSLPSLHSGTDEVTTWDRNIGNIEPFVTGPASRACGACHRANLVKEDDFGELLAFNQHTKAGGYLIEDPNRVDGGTTGEGVWDNVVELIMALFN